MLLLLELLCKSLPLRHTHREERPPLLVEIGARLEGLLQISPRSPQALGGKLQFLLFVLLFLHLKTLDQVLILRGQLVLIFLSEVSKFFIAALCGGAAVEDDVEAAGSVVD